MRKVRLLSALFLSCFAVQLSANEPSACYYGAEDKFLPQSFSKQDPENSEVDIKAQQLELYESGTSFFTGNVDVTRAGQQLSADKASYNHNSGEITADGNVRFRDSEILLEAEQAKWSTVDNEGRMGDAEYHIRQTHARGKASHVFRQGNLRTSMENASYTTCPEGSNAWALEADEVHLNHQTAVGEAENVILRMGGLPVFYTPYLNFPLNDERKSGFLVPSIGVTKETGFDYIQPYYWNIAPNLDATLAPRYMSERGLMLKGTFRYLFESSQGRVDADYLYSDDYAGDDGDRNPYQDQARKLFFWKHENRLSPNWHARINYNYVSDRNYFEDLGNSLSLASASYLERLAQTSYTTDNWRIEAKLQGYQSLSGAAQSYKRLPQVLFSSYLPEQKYGLSYAMKAEFVEFYHDSQVDGQRIDFEPSVSLPLGSAGMFITPRLALRHTQYGLHHDVGNQYDNSASRSVPVSSIDAGLFFERVFNISGQRYIQTLEPRAFYLYIPKREQSDIPVFDTGESTFNVVRLFSYDRFVGSDRVGDSNQLSLAVTSQVIDESSGREKFRLTVGQIRYFEDREVTMPGRSVETSSHSDLVAEARAYINDGWSANAQYQWDSSQSQTSLSAFGLRYRGQDGGIFNLMHRYRAEKAEINQQGLELVDVSALWPIDNRWKGFGRWYHSLEQDRTLETLVGLQYDSCCWATRFVIRDYVNDVHDNKRNLAFFFQIELTGLGKLGNKSDDLLARSIRGFNND